VIFAMEGIASAAWCDNVIRNSYQDLTAAMTGGPDLATTRRAAESLGQSLAAAGANTLMATSFKDGGTFGCLSRLRTHTKTLRTDTQLVVSGLEGRPTTRGVGLLALGADPRPGRRFGRYVRGFAGRQAFVALGQGVAEAPDSGALVRRIRTRLPSALIAAAVGNPRRVRVALDAGVDLILFQSPRVDVRPYLKAHPRQALDSCRRVVAYKQYLNPTWTGHVACQSR
jgi:hypothetical protein